MTVEQYILAMIFMSVATYLPRLLPVLLLSKRSLPPAMARWLSYIPVAVLAALLGPALLTPGGRLNLGPSDNPGLWVSIPVFLIAVYTRNIFITVLTAMGMIALWRLLL